MRKQVKERLTDDEMRLWWCYEGAVFEEQQKGGGTEAQKRMRKFEYDMNAKYLDKPKEMTDELLELLPESVKIHWLTSVFFGDEDFSSMYLNHLYNKYFNEEPL